MNRMVRRILVGSMLTLPMVVSIAAGLADSGQSTRITDSPGQSRSDGKAGHRGKSDYVLKELDLKPGDVVVDIGAGDGWWTERMVKFVGDRGMIHAAEVDQKKVDLMKKKFAGIAQIHPYLCPMDSPGLPDRSCDLAFFSESYHHLGEGAHVDYLKRMRSVIKPTGRVVIIERYTEAGLGNGRHGTRLSRLIQQAEEAGWVPMRAELMTGTYRYIAVLAQKEMFPPEPATKKARTRKAAAGVPNTAPGKDGTAAPR
jgi:ubiquinone/menaquinone biosynthesis C-methylase UbiE